jgi:hypothetical protein
MEFLPHEQRVIDEAAQNKDRLDKLKAFLDKPFVQTLNPYEIADLQSQAEVMEKLQEILDRRIWRFTKAKTDNS